MFEQLINKIVPMPKKANALSGDLLQRASRFCIIAPEAQYGPVKTAGERIRNLLQDAEGPLVQVDLVLTESPADLPCTEEGYRLTIKENLISIEGFGEKGLLYGVITLEQLWNSGCDLPAMEILDWPESPIRGIKEECRYGSNVMEREEWMLLLEDMVSKKMNTLGLAIYGCWTVQYDRRVSEYLYMPLKKYPELKTPMMVKYYSPENDAWVEYEKLPPIFCNNVLEDIFRRARDLGIQIIPAWNSLGHNTLLPAQIPGVSPIDENGVPQYYGFCTSSDATYDLLFSVFDQLIDEYMIPYGMHTINLVLDEVLPGAGRHKDDIYMRRDPWCKCPACREKSAEDIFVQHFIKLASYLKSKGIRYIMMCGDMLQEGRRHKLEDMPKRLTKAVKENGLTDNLLIDWWAYSDIPEQNWVKTTYPDLGLHGVVAPWNGYHTWCVTVQPLRNAYMLAEVNKRDGADGMLAYAMWDRACDRTHTAIAEYSWDFEMTGTPNEVTRRYAQRYFGKYADTAYRAFRLMDYITEERRTKIWSFPDPEAISNLDLLLYRLSPYNYGYVKADAPYPRAFLDEALQFLLTMREHAERALYTISTMASQAADIFENLAQKDDCDFDIAMRQAYECRNFQVLSENWLAILEIYDLTQSGDQKQIAAIARARQNVQVKLMAMCEQFKERCVAEAMAMRQHSIYLMLFTDIADYIEKTEEPKLDLMKIRDILSERSFWIR